jgi:peptidoglycan-associated lipoprotein
MKKILNLFVVLFSVLALASCGDETPESSTDYSEYVANLTLPAPVAGIAEGTQADFVARAGNTVNYEWDRYDLTMDAVRSLKLQSLWLKAYPDTNILVEGHCDERGTKKYNYALGERRANTAKSYLVSQGIAVKRIQTVSYGKDRPLDPASNESAWAKNRRAVSIVSE